MRRIPFALLSVLVAASLSTGCGFMHRHFGKKDDSNQYKTAVEEHPLEIPPDLDTPGSNGALTVPAVSANTAAPPVPASATAATPTAAAPAATVLAEGLRIKDTVDNVWPRVGNALDQSDDISVQSRNEGDHSYAVQATSERASEKEGFAKFYELGRAVLGFEDKKDTVKIGLTVHVNEDGKDGKRSTISVEGADDKTSKKAAKAVLDALRKKLLPPSESPQTNFD